MSWYDWNPFAEHHALGGLNPGSDTFIATPVLESVSKVASKLGQTVESIVSDPKKLAAVAVMVAFPEAAGAVGNSLLPAGASSALGTAGTAVVGQTAINTALNGGDVGSAVKAALIQQGLPAAAKYINTDTTFGQNLNELLGKYGAQAATNAGLAAIIGQDPVAALMFSGAQAATNLVVQGMGDGSAEFQKLPDAVQKSITSAVAAGLMGKDPNQAVASSLINSAINTAGTYAKVQSNLAAAGVPPATAEQLQSIPFGAAGTPVVDGMTNLFTAASRAGVDLTPENIQTAVEKSTATHPVTQTLTFYGPNGPYDQQVTYTAPDENALPDYIKSLTGDAHAAAPTETPTTAKDLADIVNPPAPAEPAPPTPVEATLPSQEPPTTVQDLANIVNPPAAPAPAPEAPAAPVDPEFQKWLDAARAAALAKTQPQPEAPAPAEPEPTPAAPEPAPVATETPPADTPQPGTPVPVTDLLPSQEPPTTVQDLLNIVNPPAAPAEPAPAEPIPIEPAPVETPAVPEVPTPAEPTPVEPTPAPETPAEPTPAEPTPETPPAEPVPTEAPAEPQCAPGFHWDGSMCVSDEDVAAPSTTCPDGYIFDLTTQSCVPVGGPTETPKPTPTPAPSPAPTPAPTKTPTTAKTQPNTGTDLASLIGLLGLLGGGQQVPQQPVQTPAAEVKSFKDLGYGELFGPELKFADGGSIDDLLRLLGE